MITPASVCDEALSGSLRGVARPPTDRAYGSTAMTRRSFPHGLDVGGTLLCGLIPSGRIDVHPGSPDDGPDLSPAVQRRIREAFAAGRGHGVLRLGAGEPGTDLHPTLSYWRDIGRSFVARVCGALDPTDPTSLIIPAPDPDEIAAFAESAPPMQGAELVTPALLGELWSDVGKALTVSRRRGARAVASRAT